MSTDENIFEDAKEGTVKGVRHFDETNRTDVNAQEETSGLFYDKTPLHHAACLGNVELVKFLVSKGADVNAKGGLSGTTPLHEALGIGALHASIDLVKFLVSEGADVNVRDDSGRSPLFEAVSWNSVWGKDGALCLDIVKFLVSKGADINAKDMEGKSPIDQAKQWRMGTEIPQYLCNLDTRSSGGTITQHNTIVHGVASESVEDILHFVEPQELKVKVKRQDLKNKKTVTGTGRREWSIGVFLLLKTILKLKMLITALLFVMCSTILFGIGVIAWNALRPSDALLTDYPPFSLLLSDTPTASETPIDKGQQAGQQPEPAEQPFAVPPATVVQPHTLPEPAPAPYSPEPTQPSLLMPSISFDSFDLQDECLKNGFIGAISHYALIDFVRYGSAELREKLSGARRHYDSVATSGKADAKKGIEAVQAEITAAKADIAQKTFFGEYTFSMSNVDESSFMRISSNFVARKVESVSFPMQDITGRMTGSDLGGIFAEIRLSVSGNIGSIQELTRNSSDYRTRVQFKDLRYDGGMVKADVLSIEILRVR